jgi:hypothetical protein
MQKLRAITDQLNSDFKGIQKDAPMAIQFVKDANGVRHDSIAFFGNGDFQSVRQYLYEKSGGGLGWKTVAGNVASILYTPDINNPHILVRKQKILTADDTLILSPILIDPNEFIKFSLAEWKVWPANNYFSDWIYSPAINPRLEQDIPRYAVGDISNFTIQLAADVNGVLGWIPPPPIVPVSGFGYFFNMQGGVSIANWTDQSAYGPRALKFTFKLYDSKGIIRNGRTFTHIIYLER